ncbi:MAG: hypothetical protein H7A25_21215 [Leptospiraceae bacterium]|nr:hypothetical protein [Leptospiraceae bacterium]MCP5502431.1 hypothetical protein [Leptospiraceae bacterium]
MISLKDFSLKEFRQLPLLKEGESKEIRLLPENPNLVLIWLKPTVYSFTQNRCAWIEGSNLLRARAMQTLIPLLQKSGIRHAYQEIDSTSGLILAERIFPDMDPNLEVIVKAYNSGTSFHRFYGMDKKPVRETHPFWPGLKVGKEEPYGGVKVRFDWRNPFWNPDKVKEIREKNPHFPEQVFLWEDAIRKDIMMRDETLGEDFASDIIDIKQAKKTALRTYAILQRYLAKCNIVIYDLCLFITSDGKTVYGEINQDCGRFRHLDYGSLDKDVWRSGGSTGDVLKKWELLAEMIEPKQMQ